MADGGREGSVLARELVEEHWLSGPGSSRRVRNGTWEGRGKKATLLTNQVLRCWCCRSKHVIHFIKFGLRAGLARLAVNSVEKPLTQPLVGIVEQ